MTESKNTKGDHEHDSKVAAELEALSLQLSQQVSMDDTANIHEILAQIPPENRAVFLKRLNSMAAAFTAAKDDLPPSLSVSAETLAHAIEQSHQDSVSRTRTGKQKPRDPEADLEEIGPYRILEKIGQGGMGIVYRAKHPQRGEVALKILPNVDGESLHRFKREFRSLADIAHQNLVGLRSLEFESQHWFFTMDLIDRPRSFIQYVRPNGTLDITRLSNAMLQLCEGIRKLHELNILHRDLKPSNVVVDKSERVVILDFGLVSELKRSDQTLIVQSVSGTPIYMSPEAAAAQRESFASDWYSVGVMLYQALSGELPFSGEPIQILLKKRLEDPPELAPSKEIPEALRVLCMRLVSRDPDKRPKFDDIQTTLSGDGDSVSGQLCSVEEILLGRAWHLSTLRSCYESINVTGKPAIAFINGKSGEGKSALIDRFLRDLRATSDVAILSGRCYDRESVPFKALDSLIDALVSYLRKLDFRQTACLLPDDTSMLARIFPVLMRVDAIADRPPADLSELDEEQIRKRAFRALKEILRRLAQRVAVVLACDDLQWGDADSARVLMDVLSGNAMPKLLLIGSFRSDEAKSSPFLVAWNNDFANRRDQVDITSIGVSPLTSDECQQLLSRRFPRLPEERLSEIASELFQESGGNAFFLNEAIDCLEFDEESIRRIPLSRVLTQKLTSLPDSASELLNTIAVAGQSLETTELLEAAECMPSAYSTLTAMRNLRLVRFLENDQYGRIDTYHDKIRETVLKSLGHSNRIVYHGRLGRVIESNATQLNKSTLEQILSGVDIEHPDIERIYDLSFHFNESGDTEKGGLYAFLAAEQARRQLSTVVGAQHYRLARTSVHHGQLKTQYSRFANGLAECYFWNNDLDKAKQLVDDALGRELSIYYRAKFLTLACEIALSQHHVKDALKFALEGLEVVGVDVPKSNVSLFLRTATAVVKHVARGAKLKSGDRQPTQEEVLLPQLFERCVRTSMFADGRYLLWCLLEGLQRCRKLVPTEQYTALCGAYAVTASAVGFQTHAARSAEIVHGYATKMSNESHTGLAYAWSGMSLVAAAQYKKAIEFMFHGEQFFASVGDNWFRRVIALHQSQTQFMLGLPGDAFRSNASNLIESVRSRDPRSNCTAYLACRISDGEFPLESVLERILRQDDDVLSTCNLDKARGIRSLHLHEYDKAIAFFERAIDRPYKALIFHWHVAPGFPLLTQALRLSANQLQRTEPATAKLRRQRALNVARRGTRICWFFPTEYSFALREYGEILMDLGKYARAARCLEKSCEVSEKHQTPYELAKSRLALAKLSALRGDACANTNITVAQQALEKFQQQIADALAEIEPQLAELKVG